jgi:hypothetical protein
MTFATLASEPVGLSSDGRAGYMIGGSLRFGARPYFQPGLFYQQTKIDAQATDSITLETLEDDLGISSLWIPALVGLSVIHGSAMDVHLAGGPSATIVTSVADNEFGLEKDDLESTTWGAVVGAGVDLALFSFDASYEFGLSNAFKTPEGGDTKQNVFRLSAGLRL